METNDKKPKRLAILGSTGSVGKQAVEVAIASPQLFKVEVLAANTSDELLETQIHKLHPSLAVLADEDAAKRLRARYTGKTKILGGHQAFIEAAAHPDVDMVLTSMVGFAGLLPTMRALDAKKDIALANKETLVVAGHLVMKKAREMGVRVVPVDSEHCALFQCLQGEKKETVAKLWLTASGGPFRGKKRADLEKVTVQECLAHPTWSMGQKITIDSASLVNKGLEVIEAHWLYDMPYEKIQVVVHPQSIVHSLVEFVDGVVMAQLGTTDMRLPIHYALSYPTRQPSQLPRLDFYQLQALTFEAPDQETFRGLPFAYEAGRMGGTMPCALNAANEVAVAAFLHGQIRFLDIYELIERTMAWHERSDGETIAELLEVDQAARRYAQSLLQELGGKA